MGFPKISGRQKKRAGADATERANKNDHDEGLGDKPLNNVAACAPEPARDNSLEEDPDRITVEDMGLLDSLKQFVENRNDDSSLQLETEPDSCAGIHGVDDPVRSYGPGTIPEPGLGKTRLVDPSNWFVDADPDSSGKSVDEDEKGPTEGPFEFTSALTGEIMSDETVAKNPDCVASSTASDADGIDDQVLNSDQETKSVRDDRRRHPREDSSDLIWIEYFDASMQCIGKEGARTENLGANGMRVRVKTAPSGLERVSVSYRFRGFESNAIVRERFSGKDSDDRLCLEFVDKEWRANSTCVPVENRADLGMPRKILFADDDPAFRKILGNILISAGYDVVLAEDGQSAVEKAASEKPDLVITDALMPKLHGFLVCKAIKALTSPPKVIMLTAVYTTPNYMWEAKTKFGADDILTKPCEIAHLLGTIEKHIPSSCGVA